MRFRHDPPWPISLDLKSPLCVEPGSEPDEVNFLRACMAAAAPTPLASMSSSSSSYAFLCAFLTSSSSTLSSDVCEMKLMACEKRSELPPKLDDACCTASSLLTETARRQRVHYHGEGNALTATARATVVARVQALRACNVLVSALALVVALDLL